MKKSMGKFNGKIYRKSGWNSKQIVAVGTAMLMLSTVFTVPAGTGAQKLEAVSFATRDTLRKYSIQIYKNPETDKPESGTALLENAISGSTTYSGYYTIPLPETVNLSEGDTFAIVITFETDTQIEYSYSVTWEEYGEEYVNKCNDNESYYASDGVNLVDLYSDAYKGSAKLNICIKAFTTKDDGSFDAPDILYIEQKDLSSLDISWKMVEGATGYQLCRSESVNGTYTQVASTSNTSYTDNNVAAGKTYYYKVRAYSTEDVTKYSEYSEIKSFVCDMPKVSDLNYEVDGKNVKYSWSGIDGAASYNVYLSEDGKNYTKVDTTTTTSYEKTVKYNSSENAIESDPSAVQKVMVSSPMPTVTYDNNTYGKVTVTINKVDDIDKYELYKFDNVANKSTLIKTFTGNEGRSYVETYTSAEEGSYTYFWAREYSLVDGKYVEGTCVNNFQSCYRKKPALTNVKYEISATGYPKITWDSYGSSYVYYNVYISEN